MHVSDGELLQRYVASHDETAIAELVRRHLNLVYSSALRQVAGDTAVAEDVAQDVFVALSHKAAGLQQRDGLGGWLYTSTCFAARKRLRTERRRRAREESYAMNDAPAKASPPEPDWSELRPVLDAAMQELPDRDREVVLLRFFEQRPIAEIGQRLGLNENAAAKSIERALGRLRERLARHGISSAGSALGVLIANQAVSAAPAALATNIATAISASTGAATAGSAVVFFMSKTSITLIVAGGLIVASVALNVHQARRSQFMRSELDALRQQWVRVGTEVHADREALQATRRELQALRERVGSLAPVSTASAKTNAAAAAPASASAARTTPTPATPEAKPFTNRGRATPSDLLETVMWASAHGDAKALAEATAFSSEDTKILKAWFDELPEATRAAFGSPEIAGCAVTLSFSIVAGRDQGYVQVLGERAEADTLHVQVRRGGEGGFRDQNETLLKFPDGWKVSIPAGRLTPDRKAQFQSAAISIASAVKS